MECPLVVDHYEFVLEEVLELLFCRFENNDQSGVIPYIVVNPEARAEPVLVLVSVNRIKDGRILAEIKERIAFFRIVICKLIDVSVLVIIRVNGNCPYVLILLSVLFGYYGEDLGCFGNIRRDYSFFPALLDIINNVYRTFRYFLDKQ